MIMMMMKIRELMFLNPGSDDDNDDDNDGDEDDDNDVMLIRMMVMMIIMIVMMMMIIMMMMVMAQGPHGLSASLALSGATLCLGLEIAPGSLPGALWSYFLTWDRKWLQEASLELSGTTFWPGPRNGSRRRL